MAWRRPWIKLWVELLDDPKIIALTESQRWAWCALLLAAARSPEPGRLLLPNGRAMSPEQVREAARCMGMDSNAFGETLALLEELDMVRWDDGALEIIHWNQRQEPQDATAAERMRRYRERRKQDQPSPSVTDVTPGVTEPVTPAVTPMVTPHEAQEGPQNLASGRAPNVLQEGHADRGSRNNRNGVRNDGHDNQRNGVTVLRVQEEERGRGGWGYAPPQKKRTYEENPSGAIAPSGATPGFSGDSATLNLNLDDSEGNPETARNGVTAVTTVKGSDVTRDGEGTAPRLKNNGEDSGPDFDRDGGDSPDHNRDRMSGRSPSGEGRIKTGGNPEVDHVLGAIQRLWGQPIVHWAKEAREVKAALSRGYGTKQIVECWKAAQESTRWKGRWMPMAFLVEDLGEFCNGGGRPLRKWGGQPGKEVPDAGPSAIPTAEDWRSRRGRW